MELAREYMSGMIDEDTNWMMRKDEDGRTVWHYASSCRYTLEILMSQAVQGPQWEEVGRELGGLIERESRREREAESAMVEKLGTRYL